MVSAMMSSSALLSLGMMEHEKGSGRLVEGNDQFYFPVLTKNGVYLMVPPVDLYSD
jgi:hypothetical protein